MKSDTRTYTTKEIAKRLAIEPVTVRKYVQLLEDKGYIYEKNEQNWRVFGEEDLKSLEYFVVLRSTGISVEQAAERVASLYQHKLSVSNTDIAIQAENPLMQFIESQEKFNRELLDRLDRQQEYIDQRLNQRDELLVTALREILDSKKQIASSEKKKWFQFWK